jgi:M6 family metalloprotease-like protein
MLPVVAGFAWLSREKGVDRMTLERRSKRSLVYLLVFAAWLLITPPQESPASPPKDLQPMPPPPALVEKLRREGRALPDLSAGWERGIDRPSRFPAPPSGTFNLLAVAVDFSDRPSTVPATFFDTLVFAAPGSGSVADYYDEISYGSLTLVTLNLPGTTGWQRAPRTYNGVGGYVDADGIPGTADDYGWGTFPLNLQGIVADVIPLLDPVVDFSQYDNDGDGFVDSVVFIHAGNGAELTGLAKDIWSAAWNMTDANGPGPLATNDGVSIDNFAFDPEYMVAPGDQTIGVYCHELGHTLFGLPDLYDLDLTSWGAGYWSLMAMGGWNGPAIWVPWLGFWISGGASPAWPDAWSRTVMGFEHPLPTDGAQLGFPFPPVTSGGPTTVRLASPQLGPDEYFLLENRQQMGFDSWLPGAGLLIWHVDEEKWNRWELNTYECTLSPGCQCPVWHPLVSLEQADGLLHLENKVNAGDAGDPFPGSTNNLIFGFNTTPESSSWFASPCPAKSCITATITTTLPGPPVITANLEVVCQQPGGCVNVLPVGQVGWGLPGSDVLYRTSVQNCSNAFDFAITLSTAGAWPSVTYDPYSGLPITGTALFPGYAWYVGLTATVPAHTLPGDLDVTTLSAASSTPGVVATGVFTTQVPHCVLVVDDDRGTPDVESIYTTALAHLAIPFDYWDTDRLGSPDPATLGAHPAVVWFTGPGMPQFGTLSPRDEDALARYLDGGGQLFLSSQDYLWDAGRTAFSRDYMRVATYTLDTGTATVRGVTTDPVGGNVPAPFALSPVATYSDRLTAHPPASQAFLDDAGLANALTYSPGPWRMLFLAWPFESLAQPAADAVMASAMNWFGVQPRVAAAFDVLPTRACVGATVTFADTSSGGPGAWAWDLDGDGTVDSHDANPTWHYDVPGVYTATLHVTRTAGCATSIDSTSRSVTVASPTAGFAPSSSLVQIGQAITFTNTSVGATSYAWDFGDGIGTSTAVHPTYHYAAAGVYTVTLTASDAYGCADVYAEGVQVDPFRVYLPLVRRSQP